MLELFFLSGSPPPRHWLLFELPKTEKVLQPITQELECNILVYKSESSFKSWQSVSLLVIIPAPLQMKEGTANYGDLPQIENWMTNQYGVAKVSLFLLLSECNILSWTKDGKKKLNNWISALRNVLKEAMSTADSRPQGRILSEFLTSEPGSQQLEERQLCQEGLLTRAESSWVTRALASVGPMGDRAQQ